MNIALAVSVLAVAQSPCGSYNHVRAGEIFPAYDMKNWKLLNFFQYEFSGALRTPDGLVMRSGDLIKTSQIELALSHHNEREALDSMYTESMGTSLGYHRVIRGCERPCAGVASLVTHSSGRACFELNEVCPLWWYDRTNTRTEVEGSMPLPSWYVEDASSSMVLYDQVTERDIHVREVKHIPWSIEPWESVTSGNKPRNLQLYRGALSIWAKKNNVGTLYLGYPASAVNLDAVWATSVSDKEKDLLKPFRRHAHKQVAAMVEGRFYEPPSPSVHASNILPQEHPLLNIDSGNTRIPMADVYKLGSLLDADPSLAGL